MKYLFVHQNFPGQFLHLVRHLVAQRGNDVVFITQANANVIPGVTKLVYAADRPSRRTHADAADFEAATRRAAAVATTAAALRGNGFTPDVVIGHAGWGEMLNIADIWPAVPRVVYREYFYHLAGADVGFDPEFPVLPAQLARIRAKNAAIMLDLLGNDPGVTSTEWQRSLFPAWAQPGLSVIPDGVDLHTCCADPRAKGADFQFGPMVVEAGAPLLTYVARDLEPYRGFHVLMRALPALMQDMPDLKVICLGGDGVSYGLPPRQGSWRSSLWNEVGGQVDPSRILFAGKVAYGHYLRLLQRSDVHAYLSYPFIPSWSLREAMACGCAIVGSDVAPVREFITHGSSGVLTPALDPTALAAALYGLLTDEPARAAYGQAARKTALATMALDDHFSRWCGLLERTARPARMDF